VLIAARGLVRGLVGDTEEGAPGVCAGTVSAPG
jgi:hypothetical protein